MKLSDFKKGQRVQLHPGTDRWMRGDRYGEIFGIGRRYLAVKMDKSGDIVRFLPSAIGEIV